MKAMAAGLGLGVALLYALVLWERRTFIALMLDPGVVPSRKDAPRVGHNRPAYTASGAYTMEWDA